MSTINLTEQVTKGEATPFKYVVWQTPDRLHRARRVVLYNNMHAKTNYLRSATVDNRAAVDHCVIPA